MQRTAYGMRSLTVLIAIAACTAARRDQAKHSGSDATGYDAGSDATGSDATSNGVFPPTTTVVELDWSGGTSSLPAPGPGSTCMPLTAQYVYVIATGELNWSICQAPTPGGTYSTVPGQATLTAAQADALLTALRGLSQPAQACGSDVIETYTFTTPHGAVTVENGACLQGDDAVWAAIYAVTGG
jgi:hypothetical protein